MESWFYLLRLANHMQKLQIHHGDSTLLRSLNLIENLQIHHGESGPYLLRLVNLIENFQVYYGESVLFYTLGKPITKLPHILLLFLAAVE